MSVNPASCSKLFHVSWETQGWSRPESVVEEPPTFEQSEHQREAKPGPGQFHDRHRAAGAEQGFDLVKRLTQVFRGVHDVRRNNQVPNECKCVSLFDGVTLDIERPALNERILGEFIMGVRARGSVERYR